MLDRPPSRPAAVRTRFAHVSKPHRFDSAAKPSRDAGSPAARRARERRARQRAGITRDLRVRVPTRRLAKAMQEANPRLPEGDLTHEEIEAELHEIVLAFIERWCGKNPHA